MFLFPLSYAQERMWFLHKYHHGEDKHYNFALSIEFLGFLDVLALEKSLNKIVERHEVYRTTFVENETGVYQTIQPHQTFSLIVEQVLSEHDAREIMTQDASISFNLASEQPVRMRLFSVKPDHHILLMNQHHIVHDGGSIELFKKEMLSLYQSYLQKKDPFNLPVLPIQYKEFAQYQRNALISGRFDNQLAYWKSKLSGITPLNLPTDYTRSLVQTYHGKHHDFSIPLDIVKNIKRLTSTYQVSTFTVLLTCFYILLHRYSDQNDIVTGTVIAHRNHEEIQSLIGLFINTITLRIIIKDRSSVKDLLFDVKDTIHEALLHHDIPFEQVIRELNLARTTNEQPIFQTMFFYRTEEDVSPITFPDIRTHLKFVHNNTAKYDLSFNVQKTSSEIHGFIEYNTDIYCEKTMRHMLAHFTYLLREMTKDPAQLIDNLNIITPEEHDVILNQWNKPLIAYDEVALIHTLFERRAMLNPEHPALFYGNDSLSYKALNETSNQLAHYLYKIGVDQEAAIAVAVHRSFDLVTILMAILKVGGAYVPLDPNYPKARLQYILRQSDAKILITESLLLASLGLDTFAQILLIEDLKLIIQDESTGNLELIFNEKHLALIHYTSGSTGDPKGVMLEHGSLCASFRWLQNIYSLQSTDAMLQHTLYSFDIFTCELFWPLMVGASAVLVESGREKDIPHLMNILYRHKIKTIFCVPSMLTLLLEDQGFVENTYLKHVLSTGEALSIELKDMFYQNCTARLYNLYGPTESAIFVSYDDCEPTEKLITIGRPIDGKLVLIFNRNNQLQPVGIPGELCVGGEIARKYYGMSELSAEKFFFYTIHGKECRFYRTGDIAKYLHDGRIEYLGRSDFQIKLQGRRIELTEIEMYLNRHYEIKKSVVMVKKYKNNDVLVGYYTCYSDNTACNSGVLHEYLAEYLPNYMIPSFFIQLTRIPLTPSGKIDRIALPEPKDELDCVREKYVAPRNEVEFKLIKLLEQLLKVNKISVYDDFFQLGGTSLVAVRFILMIKKVFAKTLPFSILFNKGTIADISKFLAISVRDLVAETILPIYESRGSHTLFLAHPVEGLSYLYTPLASHLREYALYGLNNPYFYDRSKAFTSIEEMAAHYIEAIKTVQPNGPYYLCGWSAGGQIVYEMALQLKKRKDKVAVVIFIDTFHTDIKTIHEGLDVRISRVLKAEGINPETEEGHYFALEYKQNVALLQKYAAKFYDGRVVLIKAQDIDKNIKDDAYNGWQPYVLPPIQVYSIPGEHSRLLDVEYIDNLARILKEILL